MAVTSRARRLATASGNIYKTERMSDVLVKRAIIEGKIKAENFEQKKESISKVLKATGKAFEFKQDMNTARRGGFEGGIFKYLSSPDEVAKANIKANEAMEMGENYYYNSSTGEFEEAIEADDVSLTVDSGSKRKAAWKRRTSDEGYLNRMRKATQEALGASSGLVTNENFSAAANDGPGSFESLEDLKANGSYVNKDFVRIYTGEEEQSRDGILGNIMSELRGGNNR